MEPKESLTIWYHGTNAKNAASILSEGLRAGSYVGQGLASALEFGGEYIFEVALPSSWFSEAGWQMTLVEPLSVSAIVAHYRLQKTVLHENDALRKRVFESNVT
jgi:hypothetical protein